MVDVSKLASPKNDSLLAITLPFLALLRDVIYFAEAPHG